MRPTHFAGIALLLILVGCATVETCTPMPVESLVSSYTHPDGRATVVSVWHPSGPGRYPHTVFSHGASSAPNAYVSLLEHIASLGIIVVAPQHLDTDTLEQTARPSREKVWSTRKRDVAALLDGDTLTTLLPRGVEPSGVAVLAGHSFGAFTVQTLVGAAASGESPRVSEQSVSALIALSPPGPIPGFIDETAWDRIEIPQLVTTGTGDVFPGFLDDWRLHAIAHERSVPGDQWLWVGVDVDHYFGRLIGRLEIDSEPQQPQYDDALATISAFLARYVPLASAGCSTLREQSNSIATLTRR